MATTSTEARLRPPPRARPATPRGPARAALASALGLVFFASGARGDDAATAERLFQEGKALMDSGQIALACPRLADSQRAEPAGGAALLLALCYEASGQTASAWSAYQDALTIARRDGRADREERASERIAALEPKLSRLTVVVRPESALLPGFALKRDGLRLAQAAWNTTLPIDPGPHVLEASARGYAPWRATVTMGAVGDAKVQAVPPLRALSSGPGEASAPGRLDRRVAGWMTGGLGLVLLGVGTALGASALSKSHEAAKLCPDAACGDPAALAFRREARQTGAAAGVGLGLGTIGVGVGIYLLTTARSSASPAAGASFFVGPAIDRSSGGLVGGGAW